MANDGKKFDIEVGTTADTSGLEATERALKAVETAGKAAVNPMADRSQLAAGAEGISELEVAANRAEQSVTELEAAVSDLAKGNEALREEQRQADVDLAQRLKAEREHTAQAEETPKVQDAQIARAGALGVVALVAKGAWSALSDAVKEYRRLAPEAAEEFSEPFDTIELALQTIQDPIGTLIEGLTGTQQALKELAASQAEAARQEANYLETLKRRQEELATASRNRINNFLAAEKRAIEENTAAYERQRRVIEALAGAEEARARAQDAIAIANGADPNQVAAAAAARQNTRDTSAQDAKVVAAEQALEAAQKSYEAAVSALALGQTGTREEIAALSNAAQEAQAAVSDAVKEVETIKIEAEAAKSAISSEAVTQQTGVVDAAKSALTQAAETAKTTLENEAAEQGKTLSAGGKEALKILTDALKDGVVTPEEMQAVATAIQQVKNSRDNADAEIRESFEELEKANNATIAAMSEIKARLRAQAAQIEALFAQAF